MKNCVIAFILIITLSSWGQKSFPKLDLSGYKNKFHVGAMEKFDLSSTDINFGDLYELNLDDYFCFFQKELNYSSIEINPYFLYSIQKITNDFSSLTILHYKEALFTELILLTYDNEGRKISEITVAIEGGDGEWGFQKKSEYENDSLISSNYIESEMIEERDSSEVWSTTKVNTIYQISEKGFISKIKQDSTSVKEEIDLNYR